MEKIKIVLDWFANTNHTGLLYAQKTNRFKEAGLDVEIEGQVHGEMELHGADFVCGPEISMLDCLEKEIDLTAVAVFTQKCDSGIVSLKRAGISRPRDLMGKRLTHWSAAWYHAAMKYIVEKDGGEYDRIHLVELDVGDIVETLEHTADATWVYENWENFELLQAGKEINYFNLGDIDPIFDFIAPAIAATGDMIRNRPDVIRCFLSVLDSAYREVAQHPELVLFVKEMMPTTASDDMLLSSQKHMSEILLDRQGRWGRIEDIRWNRMADFLLAQGVISKRRNNEFTNGFFDDEYHA